MLFANKIVDRVHSQDFIKLSQNVRLNLSQTLNVSPGLEKRYGLVVVEFPTAAEDLDQNFYNVRVPDFGAAIVECEAKIEVLVWEFDFLDCVDEIFAAAQEHFFE